MQIQIDLRDQPWYDDSDIFQTLEQWIAYEKFLYEQKPKSRPFNTPDKFPCIAINTGGHNDSDGIRQEHYAFIYNFGSPELMFE